MIPRGLKNSEKWKKDMLISPCRCELITINILWLLILLRLPVVWSICGLPRRQGRGSSSSERWTSCWYLSLSASSRSRWGINGSVLTHLDTGNWLPSLSYQTEYSVQHLLRSKMCKFQPTMIRDVRLLNPSPTASATIPSRPSAYRWLQPLWIVGEWDIPTNSSCD